MKKFYLLFIHEDFAKIIKESYGADSVIDHKGYFVLAASEVNPEGRFFYANFTNGKDGDNRTFIKLHFEPSNLFFYQEVDDPNYKEKFGFDPKI
ncbi:MAG: hypothetical protein ABI543_10870 [Ignavibacteria bacterium]